MHRRTSRLKRRYGRAFPQSDPRPSNYHKETVTGTLVSVNPTGGFLTLNAGGRDVRVEFKNADYHASGSSSRAYQSLLNMHKLVGRRVMAEVTYHSAFGWTIFGRKAIGVL
jgi:hypothetical protein